MESWVVVVSFFNFISFYVPNADLLWSKEDKLKQKKCHFRNITQTSSAIKHSHLNTNSTCPILPSPHRINNLANKSQTLIRERSFNEHHYCRVIFTLDRFKSLYNHDQTRPAEQVTLLGNINWKIMNIISVLKQLLVYSLGRLMWDKSKSLDRINIIAWVQNKCFLTVCCLHRQQVSKGVS